MDRNHSHSLDPQPEVLFIARSRCLQLGDHTCDLIPKASLLLEYFIQHPNRDLAKHAIQKAVWPDHHVGEDGLKQLIKILRTRLAWIAPERTFIVTIRGVGYRFVGRARLHTSQHPPTVARSAVEQMEPLAPVHRVVTPHRRRELADLEKYRRLVLSGQRHTLLINSEAGAGKTRHLQKFLTDITNRKMHRVAAASCIDRTGGSTPFLPFLKALWHLSYIDPDNQRLMQRLSLIISRKLRQVRGTKGRLLPLDTEASRLVTAKRLMGEITAFIETVSLERGLILWLDDLQHVDESSMELFYHLARRRQPARLLLIGTHRPLSQYQSHHSFSRLVTRLMAQGQATSLLLSPHRDVLGRQ